MKKHFFTLILLSFTVGSFAQELIYETSFEAAKAKAKATGKKVLVYIAPDLSFRPSEPYISVTTPLYIEEPESIKAINQNFVAYKIMSESHEAKKLRRTHSLNILPAYLFYHPNGVLFQKVSFQLSYLGSHHKVIQDAVLLGKGLPTSKQKRKLTKDPFSESTLFSDLESNKNLFLNEISTRKNE